MSDEVVIAGGARSAGLAASLILNRAVEVQISGGSDVLSSGGSPDPGAGARRAEARLAEKIASNAARAEAGVSRQRRRWLARRGR